MDILFPAEAHLRPRIAATAAVVPDMPGEADARAWLDAERANLVAVVVHCAGHGWPRHAAGLAATLFRYLMDGSHLPEAHTIYGHALQAARRSGDLAAEAEALNGLGGIGIMRGHFRDAAGHYQAALERYRQLRRPGRRGPGPAQSRHHRAPAAQPPVSGRLLPPGHRRLRGRRGQPRRGARAGQPRRRRDRAGLLRPGGRAPAARPAGVPRREATSSARPRALERIGELSLRRGQLTQAADFFEQALAIYRRIGHPVGVADAAMQSRRGQPAPGRIPAGHRLSAAGTRAVPADRLPVRRDP